MTLKKHGKENRQAEETLTKFVNIHIQMTPSTKVPPKEFSLNKMLVLYLQLMFPTIKIAINHFIVHVGKYHHKYQNLTKLHTTTKALDFPN